MKQRERAVITLQNMLSSRSQQIPRVISHSKDLDTFSLNERGRVNVLHMGLGAQNA